MSTFALAIVMSSTFWEFGITDLVCSNFCSSFLGGYHSSVCIWKLISIDTLCTWFFLQLRDVCCGYPSVDIYPCTDLDGTSCCTWLSHHRASPHRFPSCLLNETLPCIGSRQDTSSLCGNEYSLLIRFLLPWDWRVWFLLLVVDIILCL